LLREHHALPDVLAEGPADLPDHAVAAREDPLRSRQRRGAAVASVDALHVAETRRVDQDRDRALTPGHDVEPSVCVEIRNRDAAAAAAILDRRAEAPVAAVEIDRCRGRDQVGGPVAVEVAARSNRAVYRI